MMKLFLALVALVFTGSLGLHAQRSIDPAQGPLQAVAALMGIHDRDPRQSRDAVQGIMAHTDVVDLRTQRPFDPAQGPLQAVAALMGIHDRDPRQFRDAVQDVTALVNALEPPVRQPYDLTQNIAVPANTRNLHLRQPADPVQGIAALTDAHDRSTRQSANPEHAMTDFANAHGRHALRTASSTQDETTLVNPSDEHAQRSTDLAQEVAALINSVRTKPSSFLPDIEAYYRHVRSFTPNKRELSKAVGEIRKLLTKQKPLTPLMFDSTLIRAAIDHLRDTERHALIGHIGSDGSTPLDRVKRYGNRTTIGECITYGQRNAAMILAAFLVDEGTPDRGHRINILNPNYTSVGIATGTHPKYGTTAVVVLAAP